VGLKLDGTYQLLVYADGVYPLGDNMYKCIKKSVESFIDAGTKVGLELNSNKFKYILKSRHQNAGQNHDIKISDVTFENGTQFKYLGVTLTREILIQEKTEFAYSLSQFGPEYFAF
jgi:hypothetical protein